jgi:hypothetical protein
MNKIKNWTKFNESNTYTYTLLNKNDEVVEIEADDIDGANRKVMDLYRGTDPMLTHMNGKLIDWNKPTANFGAMKETNEGIDNNSTNLREELNSLLKDFNLEKDLESKWKKAGVVRTFLKNNDDIEGVNDKFLWEVFDTYCEHLGSFATAMVYTGNDINDGIEMVDNGYLFDIDGFNPFEG